MVRPAVLQFDLPDSLSADRPPELRGLRRDEVRLLTARRGNGAAPARLTHSRFLDLPEFLRPGDCLVFNASRTLPAALRCPAREGLPEMRLRLARRHVDGTWSALVLDGTDSPWSAELAGEKFSLAEDPLGRVLSGRFLEPDPALPRLWKLRFDLSGPELMDCLCRSGQPVRYWYSAAPWDMDYYQTVYAREPGSVEMPSAGRAFSWRLLAALRRKGIGAAYIVLHAGLSSYMDEAFDAQHPASEEPYRIGAHAASAVNAARVSGGRIIAVGTTVVRALESACGEDGRVSPTQSSTRLRITARHRLRAVDGLITGLHEPQASHLDLLSAFLPADQLAAVYREALGEKYLWHEFGDMNLIL